MQNSFGKDTRSWWGEEHEEDFTFTVYPSVPYVSYADVSY